MFAVVLISTLLSAVLAVYNQWTWISGASGTDGTAYYQNIRSYTKQTTPAAKISFSSAYGKNHRCLYVFGGYGKPVSGPNYRGTLNDLWSFDTETEQWAFWGRGYDFDDMGFYVDRGRFSTGYPSPRDNAMMVFDESNQLIYIYGGLVENYNNLQALDDLWVYNTTSNQYKWLGGNEPEKDLVHSDTPSPRMVSGYVEDTKTGNVYLSETLALVQEDTDNALYRLRKTWVFNVNSANWTMLDGSFPLSNYSQSSLLYDPFMNNIIVFAGYDDEVESNIMSSNTFYYNTVSKSWRLAREGGTNNGVYGDRFEVSPTNFPGARSKHFSDIDIAQRRLIVFGGVGYGVTFGTRGYLNDLWTYDLDKYIWTWVAGSRSVDQTQRITEKGQSGPLVSPGGKASGVGFYDEITQRFYIFGGNEKPSRPGEVILSNQVWYFDFKYIPPVTTTTTGVQTTTQSSTTGGGQLFNSQTISTESRIDGGNENLNDGQNTKTTTPNDVIIPVAAVILSVLLMLGLILYTYQRIKRRMMDDLKELEAAKSKRRKSEVKATKSKKHTSKRHAHDTDKQSRRNSSRRESEDDMPTKKRQNAVQSDEEDVAYDRARKRSSNHSIEETRNSVRGGKTKSSLEQQDNLRQASSSDYKQREKTASSHRFA